jgi:triosephosphate isomerase
LAGLEDAEELLDVIVRAYEPIKQLGIRFPAATADIELVKNSIKHCSCYVLEQAKICGRRCHPGYVKGAGRYAGYMMV